MNEFKEQAMHTVDIDPDAVLATAAALPRGRPVVMINLLRYRERAEYGNLTEFAPCSGREAYYERYAPVSTPLVMAEGGKVTWFGHVIGRVIAPPSEHWDDVILVEYPDFGCLQRVFANPKYRAVVLHRTAALEDSRLLASVTSQAVISATGVR
jgi:uncharacterized protein (DUF1330 family)